MSPSDVREMKRKEDRKKSVKGKGRKEICTQKDCIKQFLQKKGILSKNNATISMIMLRKFLERKLFLKLWAVRKV